VKPSNGDLGRAIRRLRKERKLTIEALAFAADMHLTYLSGIERGRRNPTFGKLLGIADALEVSMSSLFAEAEVEAQLSARMREARRELGLPEPLRLPGDPHALSRALAENRGCSISN
jgi:transcriptional regulator with XRE-family HTH domain